MSRKQPFPDQVVSDLLEKCHRRCCICHKFCGVKLEVHHIVHASVGGPSTFENAIALCFDCHAEIGHYDNNHPRGRKFREEELKRHREQWLDLCANKPQVLVAAAAWQGTGPLESLLAEIELNALIASQPGADKLGAPFEMNQLRRAMSEGTWVLLEQIVRDAVANAFVAMSRANTYLLPLGSIGHQRELNDRINDAQQWVLKAKGPIDSAIQALSRVDDP